MKTYSVVMYYHPARTPEAKTIIYKHKKHRIPMCIDGVFIFTPRNDRNISDVIYRDFYIKKDKTFIKNHPELYKLFNWLERAAFGINPMVCHNNFTKEEVKELKNKIIAVCEKNNIEILK